MRKMNLDNFPRWGHTIKHPDGNINWGEVDGITTDFEYDEIKGFITIVRCDKVNEIVYLKYLDREIFPLSISGFRECMLGILSDKIKYDFTINIGDNFKDGRRDLTIIDREFRKIEVFNKKQSKYYTHNIKWYKYKCNKCGYEGWIEQSNLTSSKNGCSVCNQSPNKVEEGMNDVTSTAPWMIPYFLNGIDEAKKYTKSSNKMIIAICPDCGKIRQKGISVGTINRTHSIGCNCGDGFSYPEKIMNSVLEQLNLKFTTQLSKIIFEWCEKYRYDFYIHPSYVIETHGIQHYEESTRKGAKSLLEEIENDRVKKELALKNGIKEENYIVIDCRESELEWIKKNIMGSNLAKHYDLSYINWLKCHEYALCNLCKRACAIKKLNPNMTTGEIGKIINIDKQTILKYLKRGHKLGWCYYNVKEERAKLGSKVGQIEKLRNSKPVEIYKGGISLGIFESATYLEEHGEEIFNIKLSHGGISRVCNNIALQHKGFTFKFVENNIINIPIISEQISS